ncbi:hypothetical protein B0H14DRAFT_2689874 [Mycena olivaceomarginata]|nr:hypothetical protein B0H14DRAFT_2689874 [Mycena olivaceomarginata]
MLRLNLVNFKAASTVLPRGSAPLPCRSYFRTAFVAANHRKPRLPVANSKLPGRTLNPSASPTTTQPPAEPDPQLAEPDISLEPPVQKDTRTPNSARNQFVFAGSVIFGAFLWGAGQTNAETDECIERIAHEHGVEVLNNKILVRARTMELVNKLERWGHAVAQFTASFPAIPRSTIREAYLAAANKFLNASDTVRACWGICALNGAVFIAWHVPRLAGFMVGNFAHYPLSGRARTLLTSVFSHHSLLHLLFNSMALLSFGTAVGVFLDRSPSDLLESTTKYHFLAMFISAGLVSSLASHMVKVRIGSLGASGAIYACVTLTAMAYPDLKISLLFLPWGVPIRLGVGAMMTLDLVGIIRGWRFFDHIAHLGGALFGIWYYLYGPALWARSRAIASYLFGTKPKEAKITEEWT